ncbi:type III PLP-dependent enzyme [Nonomuraea sp. 3-1Str]|uniref:type III PLP-dependent enzyme n=1 Tax=Nonomuraea sp. 3-1Str TaxID=2929801 RepID=UPI002862B231|nr:type III PLP-dependent enzyme [Nonomuraea sp. 3-1Str]MDR8412745.1 type III PLP-dependent enzyme [Nonomuraea sp. 3-1Str]
MIPAGVRDAAARLGDLPAYLYDLPGLEAHARSVRQALPGVELYYAVKANPDPELLRVLEPHVDGFEVSSGGEHAHVSALFPGKPLALGGPGKSEAELRLPHHRLHVESPGELRRLLATGLEADVLLRLNPGLAVEGAALTMSGPFGMDEAGVAQCLPLFTDRVRLRGVHAHLASGLDAPELLRLARHLLDTDHDEVNLGGGMAVDYTAPRARFGWAEYGEGLTGLRRPGQRVRIEPGRALTAYCGFYATRVVDVRRVHGRAYAVLLGGTHHLRTPVAKGHDQPFEVLPEGRGQGVTDEPVTLVGQLCTPKDVFARDVVTSVSVGDVVVFALAGAYAWNISHHAFLMHPHPEFRHLTA